MRRWKEATLCSQVAPGRDSNDLCSTDISFLEFKHAVPNWGRRSTRSIVPEVLIDSLFLEGDFPGVWYNVQTTSARHGSRLSV